MIFPNMPSVSFTDSQINDIYLQFPYSNMYLYKLFKLKSKYNQTRLHTAVLVPNFVYHVDIVEKANEILKIKGYDIDDFVQNVDQISNLMDALDSFFELKHLNLRKCNFKYKRYIKYP